MDSILTSVKKTLGIEETYTHFDPDIILHINSVFSVLTQLGVGPAEGFIIENKDAVWASYLADSNTLSFVKSYMYLKVRLLFDPPQSSAAIDSFERQAKELEWRINTAVECS